MAASQSAIDVQVEHRLDGWPAARSWDSADAPCHDQIMAWPGDAGPRVFPVRLRC